eukprot:scaffold33280_cov154-Skeletonema_menzelii.AAC.1
MREDVLTVRAREAMKSREAVEDATLTEESVVCLMGIEHPPACMKEVKTCRFRCIQAVLTEQARARARGSATRNFGWNWETIALASIAQTRKTTLRARKLGKLHQTQESICELL